MKEKKLFWHDQHAIQTVGQALKENQVVVGSSDTVLGLLAQTTAEGFLALNAIKQRLDKPYLLLVDSVEKVHYFAHNISDAALTLMQQCWPAPLTIIVSARDDMPPYMVAANRTIALRIPNHQGLLTLLRQFPALFSTSANLSGQQVPQTVADIDPHIIESVRYLILDHEDEQSQLPSTIVDCSQPTIQIIREGAYPVAQINQILDQSFFLRQ